MTTNKTQKDVQAAEAGDMGAPEVNHPDLVFGDSVYQWVGHLTMRVVKGDVIEKGRKTEKGGEVELLPYSGQCAICGKDVYVHKEGPRADERLKERLAAFESSAPNQPPTPYCQAHRPNNHPGGQNMQYKNVDAWDEPQGTISLGRR